jgi:hypothetical protein
MSDILLIDLSNNLGLILDRDSNHFPTFLFSCILMSILLYVIYNVIYFIHQYKSRKNTKLNLKSINEEE